MNFGSYDGLNREGDKIELIKKSVEDSINNKPSSNINLKKVFQKFTPKNTQKIATAKKNKKKLINNSPWGL